LNITDNIAKIKNIIQNIIILSEKSILDIFILGVDNKKIYQQNV